MKFSSYLFSIFFFSTFFVSIVGAYSDEYAKSIMEERLKRYDLVYGDSMQESSCIDYGILDDFLVLFGKYDSEFCAKSRVDMLRQGSIELGVSQNSGGIDIDHKTVQEIELVRGSSTKSDALLDAVFNSFDTKLTIAGEKRCAEMLCMPQVDIAELKRRQNFIHYLYTHPDFMADLDACLADIRSNEKYVFDFLGKENISYKERSLYCDLLLDPVWLKNSAIALSCLHRGLSYAWAVQFVYALHQMNFKKSFSEQYFIAFALAVSVTSMFSASQHIYTIKSLQERMIGFSQYMRAAKKLMRLLVDFRISLKFLPQASIELQKLEGYNDFLGEKFEYANEVLQDAKTFNKGNPSIFSSPGQILVSYRYLCDKEVRSNYASVMNLVGEVDVYVALAKKMHLHDQRTHAPFCFVDFIEQSEKPILELHDFWHPFVSMDRVVSNSISFNTDNGRNIVITGPNTGGKSTNMKAMVVSLLLAQSFGVAPASSVRLTPFSAIYTYLNVIDDTGAELSLFKAEVKRVQQIIDAVKRLPSNQYAFVMLDEIFTAASPEQAERLAYDCMKGLSSFENVIFVSATHFKKLVDLERVTGGVVKNYQVGVITDDNGRVAKYTYKLAPGIATVNSAEQVAQEVGLVF